MNKNTHPHYQNLFPVWLMKSKVHPIRQRVDIVERPSLLRKLDRFLDAKLTLIHAPAGYGKSTLLSSWRHQLGLSGATVCWLSLDQEDNDILQILTYIAFSLSEAGVNFFEPQIGDDLYSKDLSTRNFLSIITHIVDIQPYKVVLILDDFECLSDEAIDGVIKPLLDYAPENFHLAIASRDDRRLKITDLEAQGMAMRIKSEDLRFTLDDVDSVFGEQLNKRTLQKVYHVTEGWPVAVQMLKNTIGCEQDIDHLLEELGSSDSLITTYLSEQVFENLDQDLQAFLMNISVVDLVSCELADHLREMDNSRTLFDAVYPVRSLVLPVDQVESTYRLHPIFREYLSSLLHSTCPDRASKLHLQAASWFSNEGDIVKAVTHCVRAGCPQQGVNIVEQAGGLTIWLREGLTRLRSVLRLLDEATISNNPRMVIIQCVLDIKDANLCRARNGYDSMIEQYEATKSQYCQSDQDLINHECILLESLLAFYEGKTLSDEFCQRLLDTISKVDSHEYMTIGVQYNLLCATSVLRGLYLEALDFGNRALEAFRQLRSIYGEAYINFHFGEISFAKGRSREAENYYQAAVSLTRKHFADDKSMKLISSVLIAELKYELNQLNAMPTLIGSIPKQLEEHEAWFDIFVAGYTTASNLEFNQYGIEQALKLLDRAGVYIQSQNLRSVMNVLTCQRIDLLLRAKRDQEARDLVHNLGLTLDMYTDPQSKNIAWRETDAAACVFARLQIRNNEFDTAIATISHFHQHAISLGSVRSQLRYELLYSLAYRGKGDIRSSLEHLSLALSLSRQSGFLRSFLDEGDELADILSILVDRVETGADARDNVDRAKEILRGFSGACSQDEQPPLLSSRELEVMQQLVHGSSNKVIAKKIDISENTVRFHLKNIFAKLHVKNRLQAVSEARKQNLIP
ncbi:hypothetical protein HBA55_13955 [Pseudomaricurvus alkylphenolicus]|uniref:LuxR C-terminal-related transcriptional regulator n=1 Tax=Pseudomaricurvus alkylphenolicus TaxID=1306991 RepID=UPI00141E65CD|nr:LuxR C-terminal-related transcriptional regulator [Pseudomaricurvus alkylphenolicus]NIB40702.1 hypothetical protein [Pseudomaricurvus alkylphenolicus]